MVSFFVQSSQLQPGALAGVEAPRMASWGVKVRRLEADGICGIAGIGLRDSPIFAVVDCRRLLSMLKMKMRISLSTSAISLRGLAYFVRCRAHSAEAFDWWFGSLGENI